MASWDDYINLLLISSGAVSEAMIVNKKDGTTWATTPDFGLREYEMKSPDGSETVVNELKNLVVMAGSGSVGEQGMRINGAKYQVVKSMYDPDTSDYHNEDDSTGLVFYCKRKTAGGCCVAVTKQAIIVGTTNTARVGDCNSHVQNLAKYLLSNGF